MIPIVSASASGLPKRAGSASSQNSIGPRLYSAWWVTALASECWPTSGVWDVNTS